MNYAETSLPCIKWRFVFLAALPHPPHHQMWRSAHGGRGGSWWWKVLHILLLDLREVGIAPCGLDPVEESIWCRFFKVNIYIHRRVRILGASKREQAHEKSKMIILPLTQIDSLSIVVLVQDANTQTPHSTVWSWESDDFIQMSSWRSDS